MGQIFRNMIGALIVLAFVSGGAFAQTSGKTKAEANALFLQAKSFHDGIDQAQNLALAKDLYEAAIDAGSVDARVNLAYMYFVGEGVPQNFARARVLYTQAAKAGDTDAAENLAFMDKERLGLPKVAPKPTASVPPQRREIESKTTRTAIATVPIVPEVSEVARISIPARSYAHLEGAAPLPQVSQNLSPPTDQGDLYQGRQYAASTVFGGIIIFAGFIGLSIGWAWELWQRRKRNQARAMARLFFEHNRRVLREIYLRYPETMRRLSNRESPLAVMLSVLMVRYVIFQNALDSDAVHDTIDTNYPAKLGASILSALPEHPARARHICAAIMPQVIDLIHSDIRAFDIEAQTNTEMPVVYKNSRRNPRRIGWNPTVIQAS